jgi:hypothetical protein
VKLAETKYDNADTGCCARLDAAQWDRKELHWQEKPFLRDRVRSFLHIPLNFGAVMTRDHSAIEAAEAYPEHPFWLSDDASLWRSELYVAIDRDVPGASVDRVSGTFLTRVFEGPYRNVGRWMREMEDYARTQGHQAKKTYAFYATCPKCAKKFGKNQVVMFTQVA